jgi:hypothetical protein
MPACQIKEKKKEKQLLQRFPLRIQRSSYTIADKFSDIAVQQMESRLLED